MLIVVLVAGLFAGLVSGVAGMGVAIAALPILLYGPELFGIEPMSVKEVTGLTVVQSFASGAVNIVRHRSAGYVHRPLVLWVGLPAGALALGGALASTFLPDAAILATMAGMALAAAAVMLSPSILRGRVNGPGDEGCSGESEPPRVDRVRALSVGAVSDNVIQFWGNSRVGNTPTLGVAFGGIQGEDYWYEHTDVWANERLLNYVPQEVIDARSRRRQKAPEGEYNHILAARVTNALDQAGVQIMLGAHGQREGLAAHWEMWMFEQGGMSPHRALIAGTINGARYIGMEADLGSLEAEKLADLIVLEENPLENLRNSELVRYVMVGGRIFDALSMNEIAGEKRQRKPFWFQQ